MVWPFYVLALIAVVSSLKVVTGKQPVHALLYMVLLLLAIAGLLFMAGAPFAGALEVIVYAGAILVLFVFVVMMLNLGQSTADEERSRLTSETWATPLAVAAALFATIAFLVQSNTKAGVQTLAVQIVTAKEVGFSLFTEYVLIAQISALLLLAALVAAYHIAKKADEPLPLIGKGKKINSEDANS